MQTRLFWSQNLNSKLDCSLKRDVTLPHPHILDCIRIESTDDHFGTHEKVAIPIVGIYLYSHSYEIPMEMGIPLPCTSLVRSTNIMHCVTKNLPFSFFCDNFIDCKPIQIIFGRNIGRIQNKLTMAIFNIFMLRDASVHHNMTTTFLSVPQRKNSIVFHTFYGAFYESANRNK